MFHVIRLAFCFFIGLLIASWAAGIVARAEDGPALDRFLARVGLVELRLANMERMLAHEPQVEKRVALVRSMADLYAEELTAAADDAKRFPALKAKCDRLLAEQPSARTALLDVVLLQAEYQRAEALILSWLEDRTNRAALDEARQSLEHLAPRLSERQRELAAAVERAAEAIDDIPTEARRQAAEDQLQRQRAIVARAQFFAGWSAYYLGVAKQDPAAGRDEFATAKEHFAKLLEVADDKQYESIEPESLGLDSIWRARAVIGLGLAEIGLKRTAPAARVFTWLNHPSVAPIVRDQATYWHVQGLLNAGLAEEAARLVTTEVNSYSGNASPGKSSLCLAAVRQGAALDRADKSRQPLIEQGIRGLAKMRQFETLDKLVEKNQLDAGPEGRGFQLTWLRGRREYLAAEQSKQSDDFQRAIATLSSALSMPQARSEMNEASQARYYLGWAKYRLDDLDGAARLFQEAASALHSALPDVAVQAAWMHASCLVQQATRDRRQASTAIAALQAFKQEYPASEETQRVDALLTRLRQSHSSPEQVVRELAAVKPSDPAYPAAQYELCQLQYQLWSKAKGEPAKGEALSVKVLEAMDRFLNLATGESENERRLKAGLLGLDVLRSAAKPDEARIGKVLTAISSSADKAQSENIAAVEYQYRRLQHAQKLGDQSAVSAAANFIASHGGGTPYELPGLVVRVQAADEAVVKASPANRSEQVTAARAIYSRLVTLLGDSPATLKANKNAFAAAAKLAQYDEELGKWPEAAARLKRLVEAAPSDRRLLRRAGVACVKADDYAAALDVWRSLVNGLSSGSEEWFEAKYYQLLCLERTDPEASSKAWKQFELLFPEVRSKAWGAKFADLKRSRR